MWVAKIKLIDGKCIWASRCKKFNIYNYQYPLGFYENKAGINLVSYHILDGDIKNIKDYIKDVKKDKKVKKLDIKKNLLLSLVIEDRPKKELEAFKSMYNRKLIYLKPGVNFPDGYETWEIGSFDRKDVVKAVKYMEKYYKGELLLLNQLKVPKIFTPEIMPELTNKQYEAFKLALQNGYYKFPRKTNLIKLSKFMKISRPTFEEHLRKAENRLFNFMKELILK